MANPLMLARGVRNSWLTVESSCDFISSTSFSRVMSRIRMPRPSEPPPPSWMAKKRAWTVREAGAVRASSTVGVVCGASLSDQAQAARLTDLEELGKQVFFDPISRPAGNQSCSSCHDPAAGWTGPDSLINNTIVAQPGANFHGSGGTAIGGLKPPSNAYAIFSPPFSDQGGCLGEKD